ncbi:hypothetical protein TpMuguga_03g00832 [Theileria parva strain Muguga]|uniref:uncharacterized protein n=1 Tax=Theileria parva strain Muguga TaxID=333668 RepID=UPI001C61F05E|nr:uncharacterized protein TpMuguga_03g00832 [Theileria parva strain Muguga]KAF5153553.1 hypothetical protein TpMuguga_03g00832 [Theileria parva strain Muguga]
MEGREMGLLFRKGWFTRRIFSTVLLFVIADAFVKFEYGIPVKTDFGSSNWEYWNDKKNRQKMLSGN